MNVPRLFTYMNNANVFTVVELKELADQTGVNFSNLQTHGTIFLASGNESLHVFRPSIDWCIAAGAQD